ncbi:unnamed protein product [Caenorhabditis auriculariae]|uniref:Uncharacterized protein n=1 Tax=Caenorhabditis auriculariae TaxID=2777116 RepID=A0A8S1H0J0_9PELO|nr:unnamed protein product [Caenorhabditis auriculariae]
MSSESRGMTAIRDNLCDLGRMEIPRPKCTGMQFVATRGRQGFYRTIRENGAKYGLQIKPQGPRRPQLSSDLFHRPLTVMEENREELDAPEQTSQPSYKQDSHVNYNNNNIVVQKNVQETEQAYKYQPNPGDMLQKQRYNKSS